MTDLANETEKPSLGGSVLNDGLEIYFKQDIIQFWKSVSHNRGPMEEQRVYREMNEKNVLELAKFIFKLSRLRPSNVRINTSP